MYSLHVLTALTYIHEGGAERVERLGAVERDEASLSAHLGQDVLVLCTHNTHIRHPSHTHSHTHSLTWLERGGEAGHASPAEQLGRTASGRKHCEWDWTGLYGTVKIVTVDRRALDANTHTQTRMLQQDARQSEGVRE